MHKKAEQHFFFMTSLSWQNHQGQLTSDPVGSHSGLVWLLARCTPRTLSKHTSVDKSPINQTRTSSSLWPTCVKWSQRRSNALCGFGLDQIESLNSSFGESFKKKEKKKKKLILASWFWPTCEERQNYSGRLESLQWRQHCWHAGEKIFCNTF